MADQDKTGDGQKRKQSNGHQRSQNGTSREDRANSNGHSRPRMSLRKLGEQVLDDLQMLVGAETEGISGICRDKEGYVVTVEVLELARVPQTSDVMATYDVHVDDDGEIVEYQRQRRYLRSQVEA